MKSQQHFLSSCPQILQQHTCAICLSAYLFPIKLLKCNHIFCLSCIQSSSQLSNNNRCPLCRHPFIQSQMIHQLQLSQQMQKLYPQIINEKKKRITNKKRINLIIGNMTKQINDNEQNGNKYEWMVFVKMAEGQKNMEQYVKKVEIQLHPTFRPSLISYAVSNGVRQVQLKRIGWGTFRIGIKIYWKQNYQEKYTQLHHDLDFVPITQKSVPCYLHEKLTQ